jgi:hypothetical protein
MIGPNESLDQIIGALSASIFKGSLATTSVILFKNDITPGLATVLADLTLADFTGYAPYPVAAWDNTSRDPATGLLQILSASGNPSFVQTGTTIVNTIYGQAVIDGGKILLAERFDTPVEMDTTGKRIDLFQKIFAQAVYGPGSYED